MSECIDVGQKLDQESSSNRVLTRPCLGHMVVVDGLTTHVIKVVMRLAIPNWEESLL